MYRIGLDLGGTNTAVGVVDEEERIIRRYVLPTRIDRGVNGMIEDIVACTRSALGDIPLSVCAGMGIGCPGNCDGEHGVVRNAHNLGWNGVPVCKLVSEKLNLPNVRLANDADCAALGEVRVGAAKNSAIALLVTLGTGIGAGLVMDGVIRSGYRSLGGEFGHMCIATGGVECTCGQRGCWEAYASATGLIHQARVAAKANPNSLLQSAVPLDGKAIFAACAAGDATAKAVVNTYAAWVGVGLVNLINCLYPEIVLIGGGVSGAGEMLLTPLRDYVKAHFFVGDPELMPTICTAKLGNDAGIIGSAALVG